MKRYEEMTAAEAALLSALVFVGRLGTDNPPSGWDRINTLNALQKACMQAHPDIMASPYHATYMRPPAKLVGGR